MTRSVHGGVSWAVQKCHQWRKKLASAWPLLCINGYFRFRARAKRWKRWKFTFSYCAMNGVWLSKIVTMPGFHFVHFHFGQYFWNVSRLLFTSATKLTILILKYVWYRCGFFCRLFHVVVGNKFVFASTMRSWLDKQIRKLRRATWKIAFFSRWLGPASLRNDIAHFNSLIGYDSTCTAESSTSCIHHAIS